MRFNLAPYDVNADHLTEHLATEFERLTRAIESAKGFRLLIAQFNQQYYRDLYVARLATVQSDMQILYVEREKIVDVSQLRVRLHELAQSKAVIHVMEFNIWQVNQRQQWIKALNQQRERLACPAVLIFWLTADLLKQFAWQAPDLWSWRSGVFDFTVQAKVDHLTSPNLEKSDFTEPSELQRRLQRITELTAYLQNNEVSDALKASLLMEQGNLNNAIGEWDEAMTCFQQALALSRKLDDDADIAEAQGSIADILQARGELDEALRIRTQEQLPVFERLGDVRERAVTQGQIADILQARGELDEALRIRTEELLPVFERLGNVRERAVTQGKIADILQARGELDEALRVRTQEQLPVYERLGDVRSRAVALGKIANILQARGELDEALRIRTEEELPVYERLGDVRSILVTQTKVAIILMQLNPPRRNEANQLLCQALHAAQQMRIPEAGKIETILQGFELDC